MNNNRILNELNVIKEKIAKIEKELSKSNDTKFVLKSFKDGIETGYIHVSEKECDDFEYDISDRNHATVFTKHESEDEDPCVTYYGMDVEEGIDYFDFIHFFEPFSTVAVIILD